MSKQIKIHRLNVKGKYYVDIETCLDHECCVYEAPENFKMDEESWAAYVCKQPETDEEKLKFQEVMNWCPVEAIHDDGEIENQ